MSVVTLRRSLVGLLAAALAFGATLNTVQAETLRIGYQKYGTLVLLKSRGTLEKRLAEQGIDIRWTEFPAGPQLLEGLNVGSIDFGTAGETPPIFAQAAGADLLYIATEPNKPGSEAILVARESPIQTVADLKGKRVALNKGSNVHYLLVRALEEAGLGYHDIQPVYLPPADARAAFERGSVDAWVIWDPFFAAAEKQLDVRILRDGNGLVNNPSFYLASREYTEKHPEVIAALIEEIDGISEWIQNSPEEVTQLVAPLLGLSPEITRVAVQRQTYGAQLLSPEVIASQQRIADTFSRLKLIPRALNIQEVVWQGERSQLSQR